MTGPSDSPPVSLVSRWFVTPGCGEEARAALTRLATEVLESEPETLTYLVHTRFRGDQALQSLPPTDPGLVLFFETYRDADAFRRHVDGPVFTRFVSEHGMLFLQEGGKPYTTVEFLSRIGGEARESAAAAPARGGGTANHHPGVMFEVIANDQPRAARFYAEVFGWRYRLGTEGFAYIDFPAATPPLLGGIG